MYCISPLAGSPRLWHISLICLFVLLSIAVFYYSMETASNLLEGDDWRFLTLFYKKWVDGTLEFRDLFADQHPIVLHPLVYLFNAKMFSLQMRFGAYLGIVAKIATGGLLLGKLLGQRRVDSAQEFIFISCILLVFFGMNQTVEYSWALLTYESNVFFLAAMVFSILLDRNLAREDYRVADVVLLILAGMAAIVLLGTLIKLFFIAALLAMIPLLMLERLERRKIAGAMIVVAGIIVAHAQLLRSLGIQNYFDVSSATTIAEAVLDLPKLVMNIGYGLAAGILTPHLLHYPGRALAMAAFLFDGVVLYAVFAFYKERMWRVSLIPLILILYYLLTLVGAVLFRRVEIDTGWPLYIPRYFTYYHMGWVGVIWIFYLKSQSLTELWARRSLLVCVALAASGMFLSIGEAWKNIGYIKSANAQAEVAVCKYALGQGELDDVPPYVRGHFFSLERVSLLRENELSVFHQDSSGASRCQQVLR